MEGKELEQFNEINKERKQGIFLKQLGTIFIFLGVTMFGIKSQGVESFLKIPLIILGFILLKTGDSKQQEVDDNKDGFVLTEIQKYIIVVLTIISVAFGFWIYNIYLGLLFGLGTNMFVEAIIRLINKNTNFKVISSLILGILIIVGGCWIIYSSALDYIDDKVESYFPACETYCNNIKDVNQVVFIYVELHGVDEAICYCLTDKNIVLSETVLYETT